MLTKCKTYNMYRPTFSPTTELHDKKAHNLFQSNDISPTEIDCNNNRGCKAMGGDKSSHLGGVNVFIIDRIVTCLFG